MNIVNIGIDKSLVGGSGLGDAVERHAEYGRYLDHLDIIVYTSKKDNLKVFKIADNVFGHPSNSINKLFFIRDAQRIFRQINEQHKVDVIVCQDPFVPGYIGCLLKKRYNCKLQVNFHGDFWNNKQWLKERSINGIFLLISKYVVKRADVVRVVSPLIADKLRVNGLPDAKITVISTPVKTAADFNLSEWSDKPAVELKKLLFVGRLVEAKNLFFTLNVIAELAKLRQDFVLEIIGDGHLKKRLQQKVGELSLTNRVSFLGVKEPSELWRYYRQATALILFSTNESFGKVIVEAGLAETPAVVSRTLGAETIIKDKQTGLLVGISDLSGSLAALIKILDDQALAIELGRQARADYSVRFDRQKNIEAIVKLWRDLLK